MEAYVFDGDASVEPLLLVVGADGEVEGSLADGAPIQIVGTYVHGQMVDVGDVARVCEEEAGVGLEVYEASVGEDAAVAVEEIG